MSPSSCPGLPGDPKDAIPAGGGKSRYALQATRRKNAWTREPLTLGYKCDGERPHCARCLRGGHRCDGYDRSRKFVHTFAEPVVSNAHKKDLPAQPRPSDEDAAAFVTINVNAQIRSQLFSLFIDSYIPSSPVGKVNFRCAQTSNLIEVFPSVMNGRNSQLLDRAISALATVFVGKTVDDDRLIRHGIMLYNHAIQVFARLIPRAGLPVQEVLCANVVFQLYEVSLRVLGLPRHG